jgi:hypothetical protein
LKHYIDRLLNRSPIQNILKYKSSIAWRRKVAMSYLGIALGLEKVGARVLPYLERAGKQISPYVKQRIQPHVDAGKNLMSGAMRGEMDKASLGKYHSEHIAPKLNTVSDYTDRLSDLSARVSKRAADVSTIAETASRRLGKVSERLGNWSAYSSGTSDTRDRFERPERPMYR